MAESHAVRQAGDPGPDRLAAAGDAGSTDCYNLHGIGPTRSAVDDPADQPDVTGVGGTSLTVDRRPTRRPRRCGTTGSAAPGAEATRRTSPLRPGSRSPPPRSRRSTAVRPVRRLRDEQCREVPDVSASADPDHGDVIYFDGAGGSGRRDQRRRPRCGRAWSPSPTRGAPPRPGCSTRLYSAGRAVTAVQRHHHREQRICPRVRRPVRRPPGYDLASGWGSPRAGALLGLLSGSTSGCPAVTGLVPLLGPGDGGRRWSSRGSGLRHGHSDRPVRRDAGQRRRTHPDLGDRDHPRRRLGATVR